MFDTRTIIIPLTTLIVSTGLLFLARGIVIRLLHNWAKKTESKIDDIVIASIKTPSIYLSLLVPIGVSYASDPDKVERILLEEAKKVTNDIPGLLAEPEPFVRFIPGFPSISPSYAR